MAERIQRPVIGREIKGLDGIANALRGEVAREGVGIGEHPFFTTQVGFKQYRTAPALRDIPDDPDQINPVLEGVIERTTLAFPESEIVGTKADFSLVIKPGNTGTSTSAIAARVIDPPYDSHPMARLLFRDRNRVRLKMGLFAETPPQAPREGERWARDIGLATFSSRKALRLQGIVNAINKGIAADGTRATIGELLIFDASYNQPTRRD